jgi:hypothetical protein
MAGVREVRVTIADGKSATVTVGYEDGFTHVILYGSTVNVVAARTCSSENSSCQSAKGTWHKSDEYRARSDNH